MSITMSSMTWSSTTVDSRSIHDRHTSNTNSAMHVKLSSDSSTSKKVTKLETSMEETLEKLQTSASKMEEAEKEFKDKDDD